MIVIMLQVTLKMVHILQSQLNPSNGYTGVVTMEVADGKITSLVYDSLNEQGESRDIYLVLVKDMMIFMVEGSPTWEEQADLLAKLCYRKPICVDKLVMDDSGKTDAVSGVSINITEFVNLAKMFKTSCWRNCCNK